jgi:hypothetical protein
MFIEAVIAAAIVALVLATTFQVIADSARRHRAVEIHRRALLVAQSEMDDVGADIPLTEGRTTGVSGDLAWRVDITPYEAEGGANSAGALWKVTVAVRPRAGGADAAVLRTLRLQPVD